jgi:2-amino-4-hydroxy-6-hydroxymethyldihydropteridine diphosphokinase
MTFSALVSLGSNLGDRRRFLLAAIDALGSCLRVVRISPIHETAAVDSPPGSPPFLNMVAAGHTALSARDFLRELELLERRFGRRRSVRNGPRTLDLDLILHSAHVVREPGLTVPHLERAFVMAPLRELHLQWKDPRTGVSLGG